MSDDPRWARRVFRILLLAYPKRTRQERGDDMWLTFERHLRDARRVGRFAVLGLWRREVIALWRGGRRARVFAREQQRAHRLTVGSGRTKSSVVSGMSWLDFKLGFRMLAKYPGLTLVGGLAIAFAIWIGAGAFEFLNQVVYPTLPLDDGDRIVGIQHWDAATSRPQRRLLHDFVTWREELETVEDLGAFRTLRRNLITEDGGGEPIGVAEISASAFRLARVPPLLGRSLVEADEQVGAPPVVVIGHRVWQIRFGGDPDVVGQTVSLGRSQGTVVGVMPEGFAFPVSHSLWIPLRLHISDYERGQGPAIRIFGRLTDGVTLDEAQAELTSLGLRAAIDFPDTHKHLRPEVTPYPHSILNLSGSQSVGLLSLNAFLVALLVLIFSNVALLMFARAATREREIIVRNALGASRGRIIMQLFAEALVLGSVGAVVGLAAASAGLRWGLGIVSGQFMEGGPLPFWFNDRLTATTVLYAALLTVLGAVIAGVVPALKATGRGVETRLRQSAAGARFGGVWTAVIVAQVAATVVFPAIAFGVRRDVVQIRSVEVGFPTEEYLSVRLEMDREVAPDRSSEISRVEFLARFHATVQELEERLMADPAVAGVTVADRLPLMYHPHRLIEVDAGGAAPLDPRWPGYRVTSASIDADYFEVLRTPILSGRSFHSGDLESGEGVVIVNESFVRRVLGDRNPIGRRVRYLYFEEWGDETRPLDEEPGPWFEIVGVVRDLGMAVDSTWKIGGFYHPVVPDSAYPVHMAVHVRGDPVSYAQRLRTAALAVDPTLRLNELVPLDKVNQAKFRFYGFWFWLTVLVSAVALLLSTAGIYSVMAFTVSRRTREIGIRVALGSDRRSIVVAIFRRPLTQVGLGIVAGGGVVAFFVRFGFGASVPEMGLVVVYAAFMMGVCMLACIVPTRRALRVEPTEALREGG